MPGPEMRVSEGFAGHAQAMESGDAGGVGRLLDGRTKYLAAAACVALCTIMLLAAGRLDAGVAQVDRPRPRPFRRPIFRTG